MFQGQNEGLHTMAWNGKRNVYTSADGDVAAAAAVAAVFVFDCTFFHAAAAEASDVEHRRRLCCLRCRRHNALTRFNICCKALISTARVFVLPLA